MSSQINPKRKVMNCEGCGRDTRNATGYCGGCGAQGHASVSDERGRKQLRGDSREAVLQLDSPEEINE
jgi:predicted amidophosphoribosyltransferase